MPEIRYLTPEEQKAAKERDRRDYMRQCIDEERNMSSNYFKGFWGALSGALAGAILYGFVRSGGWICAWVGLVMALMAARCYDAMNVKRNINKLYCVVIACVIAIPCGEIIGDIISIMADERTEPFLGEVYNYYGSNFLQYLKDSAGNLFLGYVFGAIGSFKVFKDICDHDKKLEEMELELQKAEEENEISF